MKLSYLIIIALFTLFFQSCASSYKVSDPATRTYLSNDTQEGVTLNYRYNILNKKYAKKENKKGIKLLAVRIENNSESFYTIGRNLTITNGKEYEYTLIENEMAFKQLKQKPATHLFYLLLTPLNIFSTTNQSNGVQTTETIFPIGLVLGPGITAINMITAGSANKKFKKDLMDHNVLGKTIKPGETLDGLLIINSETFESLKLKLK